MSKNTLELLHGHFQDNSIRCLSQIFEKANNAKSELEAQTLNLDLQSVLRQEMPMGVIQWKTSPSGNNHVIVIDSLCFFLNIYGITILFEDLLFLDGELSITNFHWIEDDNLVVFDVYYIVRNIRDTCICHFAPGDFFAYFAPEAKTDIPFQNYRLNGWKNEMYNVEQTP